MEQAMYIIHMLWCKVGMHGIMKMAFPIPHASKSKKYIYKWKKKSTPHFKAYEEELKKEKKKRLFEGCFFFLINLKHFQPANNLKAKLTFSQVSKNYNTKYRQQTETASLHTLSLSLSPLSKASRTSHTHRTPSPLLLLLLLRVSPQLAHANCGHRRLDPRPRPTSPRSPRYALLGNPALGLDHTGSGSNRLRFPVQLLTRPPTHLIKRCVP